MNKKILRFHYEEIIYVLMILTTNLKDYSEENLKGFAEAIHRLDVLSKSDFLKDLKLINSRINNDIISDIIDLHATISKLYSRQWYKELAGKNEILDRSNILSKQLLKDFNEEYIEPIEYSNENMGVNW